MSSGGVKKMPPPAKPISPKIPKKAPAPNKPKNISVKVG